MCYSSPFFPFFFVSLFLSLSYTLPVSPFSVELCVFLISFSFSSFDDKIVLSIIVFVVVAVTVAFYMFHERHQSHRYLCF